MVRSHERRAIQILPAVGLAALLVGCATPNNHVGPTAPLSTVPAAIGRGADVQLVSAVVETQDGAASDPLRPLEQPLETPTVDAAEPAALETLEQLESEAVAGNPVLQRLHRQAAAAHARTAYAAKLPDPKIGANFFLHPIETAAGSQRANLTIMQMLPSLERLDARAQQAHLEAIALELAYDTQRLKIVRDVRTAWYRLFVLQKQIEATVESQKSLKGLIETATAVIGVGRASPTDVRQGTMEYARIEEQIVSLKQQVKSAKAQLNRILGRLAESPLPTPTELNVQLPDWSPELLRQLAWDNQPAIAAALVQTQATQWGIEVARLQRRPEFTLSAAWFAMDDNRPPSTIVDVGEDAWSIGAQMSLPIWRYDYDAMEDEAHWKHAASHATVDDLRQQYDALLHDLWEQARAAQETANLYEKSIIPEAKSILEVNQVSFGDGGATFDRVIRDFRAVLMLELELHRARGRLATALARIRQATAVDVE